MRTPTKKYKMMQQEQVEHIRIIKVSNDVLDEKPDQVAIEEPLEIRVEYSTETGRMQKRVSVTMRTPGNDDELAAGFLFTEGVISKMDSVKEIQLHAVDQNIVNIILHENCKPVLHLMERNFYSSSSCGICGKASIDAIRVNPAFSGSGDNIKINASVLYSLPDALRKQQQVFESTGGIHASALFSFDGTFVMLREDVGRHNALDKIIGAAFIHNQLPLHEYILLLSGRASFELLQKAAMAGIKVVCAVGAPSSMAIEMAKDSGITLIGFLRHRQFNIYTGEERITI